MSLTIFQKKDETSGGTVQKVEIQPQIPKRFYSTFKIVNWVG